MVPNRGGEREEESVPVKGEDQLKNKGRSEWTVVLLRKGRLKLGTEFRGTGKTTVIQMSWHSKTSLLGITENREKAV